ncbi:hypothetical protein THRCLA_06726 [Thraustotheca clavata]|uniref:Uncharacterized protein n=1 Tax=Thraustotheca clavata TaxID=74557 RepID=A0A1V9ZK75_9STRA|nr:hypothetical protein THRCLA_06726 [Thraustotheca clavata]
MGDHLLKTHNISSWLSCIDDIAPDSVARMQNEASINNGKVPLSTLVKALALESITVLAFGERMGFNTRDATIPIKPNARKFFDALDGFMSTTERLLRYPPYIPLILYPYIPDYKQHEARADYIFGFAHKMVLKKMKSNELKDTSLLAPFLQRPELNEEEANAAAMETFIGGVDTTSTAFQWLAYSIASAANSSEIQMKIRGEVNLAMGTKSVIDQEVLGQLPYIRACVKDTLRLYLVANPNARITTDDMTILGYDIPKGTKIMMTMHTLSRDPSVFDDSNTFIPERWLKREEKSKRSKQVYSTLPFGFGVRSCVGRRLVETELCLLLAHLVRIGCDTAEPSLQGRLQTLLIPERPLTISLQPLQKLKKVNPLFEFWMVHLNKMYRTKSTLSRALSLPFNNIPAPPESGLGLFKSSLAHFLHEDGFQTLYKRFQSLHNTLGPILRFRYVPLMPYLISVADADAVAQIYRSEGQMPLRPNIIYWKLYRDRREWPRGVTASNKYAEWKKFRVGLGDHLLKTHNISSWLSPIDDVAQDTVARMQNEAIINNGKVNLSTPVKAFTLESVTALVFGERMGCITRDVNTPIEPNAKKFIDAIHGFMSTTERLLRYPPFIPLSLFPYIPAYKEHEAHSDYIFDFAHEMVLKKIKSNDLKDTSLLTLFLQRPELNEKEAISAAIDTLIGGVDTTSTAFQWLIYCIATAVNSSEIQMKIRDEVNLAMGTKSVIDQEVLGQLPYIRACVKETLRLYPVANPNARIAAEDMTILGYDIPKGTEIMMAMYTLSRDPSVFDDPDSFIPERWLEREEKSKRLKEAYSTLPFGFGARSCVGRRLAETEMYLLLAHLVRNNEIGCDNAEPPLQGKLQTFLVPERPLAISLQTLCDMLTDASLTLIRRTLSQLSILHIDECRNFSSEVLTATWCDCTKLQNLSAQGCPAVTDRFLHTIATTKRHEDYLPRYLDISKCRNVTDAGMTDIANSPQKMNLNYFAFGQCLQVQSMAFFAFETSKSLASLETLEIPNIDLDEASISWLVNGCKKLKKLNLSNCSSINDFCLLILCQLTKLKWLSLNGCYKVTSKGLSNLLSRESAGADATHRHSSAIEYLNLRNCYEIQNDGLKAIGDACADLQVINLQGLSHVSDTGINIIAKKCTQIHHIVLSGSRNVSFYGRPDVSDEGLCTISKLCRKLTILDIYGAPKVTSYGMVTIASTCHYLRELNLCDTAMEDIVLVAIARNCHQLTTLHLSKCTRLTDIAIEAIASSLFALKHLNLSYCTHLTNKACVALAATRIELSYLDLSGNPNLTDDGLLALVRGCSLLAEVRLKGCERLSEECLRQCASLLPYCGKPNANLDKASSFELPRGPLTSKVVYEGMLMRYQSTITIQYFFRKNRQRYQILLMVTKRKRLRQKRAARRIQRCFRQHLKWKIYLRRFELPKNYTILVHLQSIYRGNQCRKFVREYKPLVIAMSTRLQRCAKQFLYRRHRQTRDIQRIYRGHQGRLAAKARHQEIKNDAGSLIWHWYRRCVAKRDFINRCKIIAHNVRLIQHTYRSYHRRQCFRLVVLNVIDCAIKIQAAMRRTLAIKAVEIRRILYNKSALAIQSLYRGHKIRKWFKLYRNGILDTVIAIQSWVRCRLAMYFFKRSIYCIQIIQKRFRRYIAVRNFNSIVRLRMQLKWQFAAFCIQRNYRGHRGRCRARLFRKIRNCKYAIQGQNAAEYLYRRRFLQRGAVGIIQRWFRETYNRIRLAKIHAWRVHQGAYCICRYMKGWLSRIQYQKKRVFLTALTLDMQRVYRGHRGRCIYRALLLAYRRLMGAIEAERLVRGFLTRRSTKKMRENFTKAALLVQRIYRGKLGRHIAAIERAKLVLEAKEKYLKSVRGAVFAKINSLPRKEQKCLMERQVELLERTKRMLTRRRIGYEKKMEQIRITRQQLWLLANNVVGEHYKMHRNIIGASENVYISKLEYEEKLQRRAALTSELIDIHIKMMMFKRALRDKINETRVMEPKEFWDVANATGIFDKMDLPTKEYQTGRWTKKEHALFLEGLKLYGKSWKDISALVGTRTLVQIRTHAQKYLQKQNKPQFSNNKFYGQPLPINSTIDQLLEEDSSDDQAQTYPKRKRDEKENFVIKTYQPIAPNYKRRRDFFNPIAFTQWKMPISMNLTPLGWVQSTLE